MEEIKPGRRLGVMHFRAWGTHAPRPPMVRDATSTGSLAQTFLRKAAIPGRVDEEGHPCR